MKNETPKIKNAEQAALLKNENAATLEEIKEMIYTNASNGSDFILFFKVAPIQIQTELMNLGFSIGIVKDMMGASQTKISW